MLVCMEGKTLRIAENVRTAAAAAGITQAKLAEAIGVSEPTIYRRMTARRPFTINELLKVSVALDVPVLDLLGDLS